CGVSIGDYNNDGFDDIFCTNFGQNTLYRNNGDGTFTDIAVQRVLSKIGAKYVVKADIFCTNFGQNTLYRNNGDGTFTDVTKAAGLWNDQQRFGAGCTFVDYNRDGHLDLFVSKASRLSFENAAAPGDNPNCRWSGVPV